MLYFYRIRKYKNGRLAPGVGKKLALAFGDAENNVLTAQRPKKAIPPGSVVVNYGRTQMPDWYRDDIKILNHPTSIFNSINKLTALNILKEAGIPVPEFVADSDLVDADGTLWVARTLLKSKQGKGIILFNAGEDETPVAPLYTKYFTKTHEFRVHVFNGKVIDYVQKKKKLNVPYKVNMKIRNHAKGWVFAKKDIFHYPELEQISLDAVKALGLDFGAVDIMARLGKPKPDGNRPLLSSAVAEVNTAPGMSSKNTLDIYINAIREYMNG